MTDCYIFDHVRTPRGRGKPDGALHEATALHLAKTTLDAVRDRNGLDTALVDDVVLGCVDPIGEAGGDIARAAVFASGYGDTVPGIQINRFCSSGLEAVNFAAGRVMAGQYDLAIAGGVESMSRIGMGASGAALAADPVAALPGYFIPQGIAADLIATKFGFSRDDVDAYSVESQRRAKLAWDSGFFSQSVVSVVDINGMVICDRDEHLRETTMQSLGGLDASFAQLGSFAGFDAVAIAAHPEIEAITHVHHAGNSSGIVDGAAAVLIGTRDAGAQAGLTPRARIRSFSTVGSDPALQLTGPVDVTEKLFARTGMSFGDIDLVEINEAFASIVLRYIQAFDLDPATVNVNGGAIAMGHPLGATGAMILGTVLDELERRDRETALVTLCVAAGMGAATVIERV